MKNKLLLVVQISVSVGLLLWFFQQKQLREQLSQVLAGAQATWLLLGLVIAGFAQVLAIIRWNLYVKMLGLPIDSRQVMRIGWVGSFFNNFLIGAIGGDAVKVIWVAAKGGKKSVALLSVAMDRLSGVIGLILVSLIFMCARLDWLRQSAVVAGIVQFILGFLVITGALLLISWFCAWFGMARRIPKWGPGRNLMIDFETRYHEFFLQWRTTTIAVIYSVLIFLAYFLTFYCAGQAFAARVSVLDFFAIMPTVDVVSALPVSVAGFGVREHFFTILLGDLCGVPAAKAVLISITGALVNMVWGLVGLIALPEYRRSGV